LTPQSASQLRKRDLYCHYCDRWFDHDVVAAMNISRKDDEVFQGSKGFAQEALKGNPMMPVILGISARKLTFSREQVN